MTEIEVKTVKAVCRECRRETNHAVRAQHRQSDSDPHYPIDWSEDFQVIECLGCNTASFRSVYRHSEDTDPEGEPNYRITAHPDPLVREELEDIALVPRTLSGIYNETIRALDAGLPVLAAIGIRAIIETVCKEKQAQGNGLLDKINNLVVLGVLTQQDAGVLHKLRTLGNVAAHEVKAHSHEQLNLAMRVVEHLLQAVYILPHHARETFV